MKKRLLLLLLMLIPSLIFAEEITLTFVISNDATYTVNYDKYQKILCLSEKTLPFLEEVREYEIQEIKGFENFENLEILELKDILNYLNYGFMNDLTHLKELYINSCFLSSLAFLENLPNLEIIDIQMYITEKNAENIRNSRIDLSNLLFLKRIDFRASVISDDEEYIAFDSIPLFVNVQNQPVLNIGNNDITHLSVNQRNLLKQYSEIYLYPNPILFDNSQMEALRELNVITR